MSVAAKIAKAGAAPAKIASAAKGSVGWATTGILVFVFVLFIFSRGSAVKYYRILFK